MYGFAGDFLSISLATAFSTWNITKHAKQTPCQKLTSTPKLKHLRLRGFGTLQAGVVGCIPWRSSQWKDRHSKEKGIFSELERNNIMCHNMSQLICWCTAFLCPCFRVLSFCCVPSTSLLCTGSHAKGCWPCLLQEKPSSSVTVLTTRACRPNCSKLKSASAVLMV